MIEMDERRHANDLVAAYVLGATTPAESVMVEEHLATCARCRAVQEELSEVVFVLPEVAGERTPPPALKARLMAAVEADPIRLPVTGTASQESSTNGTGYRPGAMPLSGPVDEGERTARRPVGSRGPTARGVARPRWPRQLVALAALVALALVAAGSVGVWRALNGPQGSQQTYHVADGPIRGSLAYESGARRLTLTLSGLRPLDRAHVYELWLIRKTAHGITRLHGAGTFHPTPDGHGSLDVPNQQLGDYNLAALTREPAPGSATPTTTPFAATALS